MFRRMDDRGQSWKQPRTQVIEHSNVPFQGQEPAEHCRVKSSSLMSGTAATRTKCPRDIRL